MSGRTRAQREPTVPEPRGSMNANPEYIVLWRPPATLPSGSDL